MKTQFFNFLLLVCVLFNISTSMGQNEQKLLFDYAGIKDRKVDEPLSPYAMFGDNTATITTQHQRSQDYTLKIPIVEDGVEVGLFEMDMQTGIATMKNNDGDLLARKVLSDEERARFLTIDPMAEKYYSWSPYVYCMNNPMKYIDPTGMWVMYRDNSGEYRYRNGEWEHYETSGQNAGQYIACTPDAGSFMAGVLDGLNSLNRNVTGSELLDFFANDENTATIVAGDRNLANIEDEASGTITLSSTFSGSEIPTEKGNQMSPFWLDIGHELAHRQDVLKNGSAQARVTWLTNTDTGDKISASEKYATHMENLMRADRGLPLRTHYARQGGGGWEQSRILNPKSRVNKFNGTTYRSVPRIIIPKGLLPSTR